MLQHRILQNNDDCCIEYVIYYFTAINYVAIILVFFEKSRCSLFTCNSIKLFFIGFSFIFGVVNSSIFMMCRAVDSVHFEIFTRGCIDDVVFCSGWYNNSRSFGKNIFIAIDNAFPFSRFKAEKLVIIWMYLQSYIFFRSKCHQHKLHVFSCIEYFTKILINKRIMFDISVESMHRYFCEG